MLEVGLEPTRLSANDFESFSSAIPTFKRLQRISTHSTYPHEGQYCSCFGNYYKEGSWRYQTEYPSFSLINGFDRTRTCSSRYHTGYFSYIAFQRSTSGVINEILNNFRLKLQSLGMGRTRTYDHDTASSRDFIQLNYHSIRRWQRRTSPSNQVELVHSSLPL